MVKNGQKSHKMAIKEVHNGKEAYKYVSGHYKMLLCLFITFINKFMQFLCLKNGPKSARIFKNGLKWT